MGSARFKPEEEEDQVTAKHLVVHVFKDHAVRESCAVIQEHVKYYDPSAVIKEEGLVAMVKK